MDFRLDTTMDVDLEVAVLRKHLEEIQVQIALFEDLIGRPPKVPFPVPQLNMHSLSGSSLTDSKESLTQQGNAGRLKSLESHASAASECNEDEAPMKKLLV